jgi:hypothetical protein
MGSDIHHEISKSFDIISTTYRALAGITHRHSVCQEASVKKKGFSGINLMEIMESYFKKSPQC